MDEEGQGLFCVTQQLKLTSLTVRSTYTTQHTQCLNKPHRLTSGRFPNSAQHLRKTGETSREAIQRISGSINW